jgi:hypothetical protein
MSKKLLEQIESVLITEDQIVEKFELSDEAISLLELASFIETKTLDEALNFGKLLNKLGLKAHKGTGLIQILGKAGKNMAQMMWYAFQAVKGDEGAKVKLAEILKTKVKKEDVINFLYQLDMATAHLVTGPIHMIDAITGWHIAPNLHKASSTTEIIKKALKELEDAGKKLVGSVKNKLLSYVSNIKSDMGYANS